jgi:MYXO-CTERM domain-containing protein
LAAISTWDGNSGTVNPNWGNGGNWNTNVVPPPTDDVQFASGFNTGTTIQLNGNRIANSLIIATNQAFTIAGPTNTLTLTSGSIERNDLIGVEQDHTITANVAIGASAFWSIWGDGTLHVSGAVNGPGFALHKIGWGTLRLSGGGNFSGGLFIDEALVQLDGSGAGTGPITVTNSSGLDLNGAVVANQLVLNGEGVEQWGALRALSSSSVSGAVTLASNSTINAQAGTLTITGPISDGAGTFNLTKTGSGELRVSGNNTYNGTTTISAGTLSVTNGNAIANSSSIIIPIGATLDLVNPATINNSLNVAGAGVGGNGAIRVLGSGATLSGPISSTSGFTVGGNGAIAISGPITAVGTTISKLGTGSLTLTNPANSFGSLAIQAGTLNVSSETGLPTGSSIMLTPGASVLLSGSPTINRTLVLNGDGGTLGALGNTSGSATWAGMIFVDSNSTIHAGGNITITGEISGPSRTLTKKGAGRLTLGNSNSFAALNITEGTVALQANFASPSGATTVSPGAAFELAGNITGSGASLRLGGHGVGGQGALRGASGTNTWGGAVVLDSSTSIFVAPGAQTTVGGVISEAAAGSSITKIGAGTLVLGNSNTSSGGTFINEGTLSVSADNRLGTGPVSINGGKLLYSGNIVTSRNFSMHNGRLQAAAGAYVFLNQSQLSGGFLMGPGTFEANSGTLSGVTALAGSRLIPTGTTTLNGYINGGSVGQTNTLNWDGGINTSSGVIDINGTLNTTAFSNDGVITIHNGASLLNTGNSLVSGGGSRIDVRSGGTLHVTGNLLELNGALLVNNGTINGPTNVNFGSLAKGAGTFGAVNVTDGGRFSPGNSPGAVTTGSSSWNSGGSYLIEIADALGSAGTGWDLWNIDGILNVDASTTSNGRFTISLASLSGDLPGPAANFDLNRDYSWVILQAAGGITGFDPAEISLDTSGFKNSLGGGRFHISSTSTELSLNFSAVPEPAAMALAGAAASFMLRRRRKEHL